MKFEKLQPGMTVYDVGRHRMGNTTMSTVAVWDVYVVSVDADARTCVARWNSNSPDVYGERSIKRWRARKPVTVRSGMGSVRLATREELKKMGEERTQ